MQRGNWAPELTRPDDLLNLDPGGLYFTGELMHSLAGVLVCVGIHIELGLRELHWGFKGERGDQHSQAALLGGETPNHRAEDGQGQDRLRSQGDAAQRTLSHASAQQCPQSSSGPGCPGVLHVIVPLHHAPPLPLACCSLG